MIALFLAVALLHPVHETLAEVEWNASTQRLEIALRLHSLDEQWLRKRNARDRTDRTWEINYVQRHIRVTLPPNKGKPDDAKYTWVGRQTDGAHVWWYFEIESPDKDRPEWIEQRTLFERDNNYTNRVVILNETPKRSLSLTKARPQGILKRDELARPIR